MSKRALSWSVVVVVLLIAIILVGCKEVGQTSDKSDESVVPSSGTLQHLRIGFIPIGDASQVFIAEKVGIFREQGLSIELVPLEGGAAILQALGSDSVDVAFSNLTSVVFYQKNAGPLIQLSGGTLMDKKHSEAGLVVLADSQINGTADFGGKKIAVNSLKNIVDLAVLKLLRDAGIPPNEVQRVEVPFKDMEAALRSGRVDVAAMPEPILVKAMQSGGLRNLGDHFALAFGSLYSTGYFTTPSNYSKNRAAYDKFNAAIEKATPLANSMEAEAVAAVSSVTKVPQDLLVRAGRALFVPRLPQDAVGRMESLMRQEKLLD